jgi:hypothetical protein
MKINFYIEPDVNETWAYTTVFHRFFNYCKEHYKDIEFELKNSVLHRGVGCGSNCKYGPFFLVIENDETKKYIVVSYWDKMADIVLHNNVTFWDTENCIEIITSAGVHSDDLYYQPTNFIYTPFSYITSVVSIERQIEEVYSQNIKKQISPAPKFRGYLYAFRKYLEVDSRFTIIDKQVKYLSTDEYMQELSTNLVSLSLNGAAEICHRDMEIMGLGNALFRQKLVTQFHNKLIPNYHYIAVDYDDIDKSMGLDNYWKELSNRFIDRYYEVRDDIDYIQFVANNGREWYTQNATIDANVKLLTKLVEFGKI